MTGYPDLKKFLGNNTLDEEYMQGFFLHLLTDYLFYKKYLNGQEVKLYNDYNKLNMSLIRKYGITLPGEIKKEVKYEEGMPEIIDIDSICKFIDEVSKVDLLKSEKVIEFINSFKIINQQKGRKVSQKEIIEVGKDLGVTARMVNAVKKLFERLLKRNNPNRDNSEK